MNSLKDGSTSWSWADQLSSYRFWGLLGYFVLICGVGNFLYSSLIFRFMSLAELPTSSMVVASNIKTFAGIFGFLLAWSAVRSKSHHVFFLYGVLALVGIAFISFSSNVPLLFFGVFLFGLITGAVAIAVPAFLVGPEGRAETFVVAFGVMTAIQYASGPLIVPATFTFTLDQLNSWVFFLAMVMPIIIAMLLIIPLSNMLFNAEPPQRGVTLSVKEREPVEVFLLCLLVPFYFLYWVYRVHGEVRSLGDSSNLLSAKASAWLCVFIPFLYPIMMATVNDHINAATDGTISKKARPTWLIVTLCVLFGPASAALIQADINKAVAAGSEPLQASTA
ncbi:hypothetical protein [Pseudomonas jilinensis]|nr:hypothetical protein [Pseudomonas jilinensis]